MALLFSIRAIGRREERIELTLVVPFSFPSGAATSRRISTSGPAAVAMDSMSCLTEPLMEQS